MTPNRSAWLPTSAGSIDVEALFNERRRRGPVRRRPRAGRRTSGTPAAVRSSARCRLQAGGCAIARFLRQPRRHHGHAADRRLRRRDRHHAGAAPPASTTLAPGVRRVRAYRGGDRRARCSAATPPMRRSASRRLATPAPSGLSIDENVNGVLYLLIALESVRAAESIRQPFAILGQQHGAGSADHRHEGRRAPMRAAGSTALQSPSVPMSSIQRPVRRRGRCTKLSQRCAAGLSVANVIVDGERSRQRSIILAATYAQISCAFCGHLPDRRKALERVIGACWATAAANRMTPTALSAFRSAA